jgi:hypothetical protein
MKSLGMHARMALEFPTESKLREWQEAVNVRVERLRKQHSTAPFMGIEVLSRSTEASVERVVVELPADFASELLGYEVKPEEFLDVEGDQIVLDCVLSAKSAEPIDYDGGFDSVHVTLTLVAAQKILRDRIICDREGYSEVRRLYGPATMIWGHGGVFEGDDPFKEGPRDPEEGEIEAPEMIITKGDISFAARLRHSDIDLHSSSVLYQDLRDLLMAENPALVMFGNLF